MEDSCFTERPVPAQERALLRQLIAEYRRFQRARAVLVKRHQKMLDLVDRLAETRLRLWPVKKKPAAG